MPLIIFAGVDSGNITRIEAGAGCRVPILLGEMPEYADEHGARRRKYQNTDKNRD